MAEPKERTYSARRDYGTASLASCRIGTWKAAGSGASTVPMAGKGTLNGDQLAGRPSCARGAVASSGHRCVLFVGRRCACRNHAAKGITDKDSNSPGRSRMSFQWQPAKPVARLKARRDRSKIFFRLYQVRHLNACRAPVDRNLLRVRYGLLRAHY